MNQNSNDQAGRIAEPEMLYEKPNPKLAEELRRFGEDHVWVYENREALLEKYPEQWIAVKDRQVIASDPDFEVLLSKIPDRTHTCVEFISREPLEFIL